MKHFKILHDEDGRFEGVLVTRKAYTLLNLTTVILTALIFIIIT